MNGLLQPGDQQPGNPAAEASSPHSLASPPPGASTPDPIALALISHTNTGKTTLARTLLGRDVGEVRDAAHVTREAASYPLIADERGNALILWDTPGFGDSARLARRLAQQGNPIGWFLSEVWDRFRDQPFYLAQKAVRAVQDDADIVLYLVNAAENPEDAGYLGPELDVLAWIGRPVVVLLNQTGPPRPRDAEAAELERWRAAIGHRPQVRAVLSLDAFARCWIQEIVLLRTIAPLLESRQRPAFDHLVDCWQERRARQFADAMAALAAPLALAARDSVALPDTPLATRLRDAVKSLVAAPVENAARQAAARHLAERLDAALQASTTRLILVHDLTGSAAEAARARLQGYLRTETPVAEGKAALMGGIVSGALSGLAADLATGGLSFGAGTLVGAVAGALGGAGIARGYNVLRGRTGTVVRWDRELLDELYAGALLRYLAVAHFGRGRGEWHEPETPAFWRDVVAAEMSACSDELAGLWGRRDLTDDDGALEVAVRDSLAGSAARLLERLYPDAPALAGQVVGLALRPGAAGGM